VQSAAVLLKGKKQIGVSMRHGPTHLCCAVAVRLGLLLLLPLLFQPVADKPRGGRRMNHSHNSIEDFVLKSVLSI
jgi:hypothetical protein